MSEQRKSLGVFRSVIAALSFVPLVGVPFGLANIIWGLVTWKAGGKRLALLGALGIACTPVFYGGLIYLGFVQRGGVYDGMRAVMAKFTMAEIVQALEAYRLQHGRYPASLELLRQSMPIMIADPTTAGVGPGRHLYYELTGTDHYYLRSVGPDGQVFTADDVVPRIKAAPGATLGLLTEPPPASLGPPQE